MTRLLLLSYFFASLYAAPVLRAEERPEQIEESVVRELILNEVRTAWQERSEAFHTFRAVVNGERLYPKGSLTGKVQQAFPTHDLTLPFRITMSDAGPKVRLEVDQSLPHFDKLTIQDEKSVWVDTGEDTRSLEEFDQDDHVKHQGAIYDDFGTRRRPEVRPLIWGLRPILEGETVFDLETFTDIDELTDEGGERLFRFTDPKSFTTLLIAADQDCLPIEWSTDFKVWPDPEKLSRGQRFSAVRPRRGSPKVRIRITSTKRTDGGFPIPQTWLYEQFNPHGQLELQIATQLRDLDLNPEFSDGTFSLPFPVGAYIADERPSSRGRFIVGRDGIMMERSRAEKLMRAESNVRREGSLTLALIIWTAAVLLLLGILWLAHRAKGGST
ncbi:MAG: hypothetical protein H0T47_00400 [Planctomycetaceae bacterium]|nr:hypothetical protein [Planctomycetaceae bacterium]